jgi:hypothetical protein
MNFSILSFRTWLPAGRLAVLALAILALALSTAPAGAVAPQTATVLSLTAGYGTIQIKGNVDPGEEDAKWWAETSTDNENWSGYPGVFGEFPANAGSQPVEVEISDERGDPEKFLKGSTRYYVRLVVSDGVTNTFSFGPNQFVTTLAVDPPIVLSVNDATAITFTTAKISGSVERSANPAPAFNARCRAEYVLDSQFVLTGFKTGTPVPCIPNPVTASGSNPLSADLTGLKPGANYHYRIVALNGGGSDTVVAPNTFTTTAISPPAVTIFAPTLGGGTSVHFSGAINPQLGPAEPGLYEVKWRFECIPKCLNSNGEILTGAPIPPDNSQHTVSADVVLEHNTEYRVNLVGTNAGTSVTAGPVAVTTPPAAPVARTLGVSAGSYSANLGAKINPLNSPVTYRFEWGPTGSYGSQAPAIPEQLSRADNVFHFVTAPLAGLNPGEAYHYRVVATNTQTDEESEGADRTFTTLAAPGPPPACPNDDSRIGASARLPDCRAYEYVTPGLNGFAPAGWPEISVEGVRADGGAIAFVSGGAPEVAEGSTVANTILAQRGLGGWLTKSLSAPMLIGSGIGASRSTVGLSSDLSESVLWTNQPLVGGTSPKGTNLYLRRADGSFVVLTKAGAPTSADGGELSGASQDFTHLFIVSTVRQRSADPVSGGNTYEWANGNLKLVTILPGPGEELAPNGGTLPHGALPAVSDDGTEVLFKAGGLPGLYLRSDGENTVQVSVSKRSIPDPNPVAPAIAIGIAADGSEVVFTSRSELTDDANTGRTLGVPNDQGNDIYSYDVGTGALTDLTVGDDPADIAAGADVEKVVGTSRDASYVYFIARGNLAEGATSGERNLYVAHEGTVDFIGTNPTGSTLQGYPFYVTPDGRHAAFMSTEGQTGYDNGGQNEVYKYTYGSGVECGSCRPSGEPPLASASIVGRALSDDGSRLFFQSDDAVIPQARSGLTNVFEYAQGDIRLLTAGDGVTSRLAGASASGDDVFIATFERLSPLSQGGAFGIYDARVNADVPPEEQPAACQGESCRGTGTAPPQLSSPGTAKFEAPGTVAAPKSTTVTASKVQVRIAVPERGELSVLGRGLIPVKQPALGAETVTLELTSKADKRRLKRGFFKTTAEILFISGSGALSRAEISMKFKAAQRRSGK